MTGLLRRYPLTAFFVLAYGVTWLLWAPVVAAGVPAFSETRHVPAWSALPAVAIGVTGTAFAMTAVTEGRAGVRRMLRRLVRWRVGLRWYLVALLAIPLIELVITAAATGAGVARALTPSALALYPAAFAAHFVFGPLFEESGWRGFALPRLQDRFGPMRATLLLGVLWAGWHFFLYAPGWIGAGAVGLVNMAIFVTFTIAISVPFTWLSNRTGESLLLVILLHGSVDGTATWVQVLADRGVIPADTALFCAGMGALGAALLTAVVLAVGTRGRLGYAAVAAALAAAVATSTGFPASAAPDGGIPPVSPQAAAAGLIDVRSAVPDAVIDLRYATANNFVGTPLYPPTARCLVHESLAPGLAAAAAALRAQGLTLVFWDCYRPHEVQVTMFEAVPDPAWVARPGAYARSHEAGRSVDVTLARIGPAGGRLLDMGTDFDDFSARATAYATDGVSPAQQANRTLLRNAMATGGLAVYSGEWWHFDGPGAGTPRPILDVPLS